MDARDKPGHDGAILPTFGVKAACCYAVRDRLAKTASANPFHGATDQCGPACPDGEVSTCTIVEPSTVPCRP